MKANLQVRGPVKPKFLGGREVSGWAFNITIINTARRGTQGRKTIAWENMHSLARGRYALSLAPNLHPANVVPPPTRHQPQKTF
jgi:hypothetical protein